MLRKCGPRAVAEFLALQSICCFCACNTPPDRPTLLLYPPPAPQRMAPGHRFHFRTIYRHMPKNNKTRLLTKPYALLEQLPKILTLLLAKPRQSPKVRLESFSQPHITQVNPQSLSDLSAAALAHAVCQREHLHQQPRRICRATTARIARLKPTVIPPVHHLAKQPDRLLLDYHLVQRLGAQHQLVPTPHRFLDISQPNT